MLQWAALEQTKNGSKTALGFRVLTSATREETWVESLRRVPDWMPEERPTVIVAPHPDDETLAAGGLIAMQRCRQVPVTVLAVTDGEAAYPNVPDLGRTRRMEQLRAAEALGVVRDAVVRFELRDSAVTRSEAELTNRIEACINSNTLLVAPWRRDPHPDHEACGRAAAAAASRTGATLICYFFWTWHRFGPECLRELPLRRLSLSADACSRRAKALACHESQLHRKEDPPILPPIFLAPARRAFETFALYGNQSSL
jgi:LmbE family N-acetylglucosaminyl deacetylase